MTLNYPKRPTHFAHKFTRLLFKACVANDLGTDAVALLIAVAHQEDAKKYSGAVSYWNPQLMPLIGCRSETTFKRIRAKCIESGWLHYNPGSKSRSSSYWVVIPKSHMHWNDSPTDENLSEYTADCGPNSTRNDSDSSPPVTHNEPDSSPDLDGNADGMRTECGRNPASLHSYPFTYKPPYPQRGSFDGWEEIEVGDGTPTLRGVLGGVSAEGGTGESGGGVSQDRPR